LNSFVFRSRFLRVVLAILLLSLASARSGAQTRPTTMPTTRTFNNPNPFLRARPMIRPQPVDYSRQLVASGFKVLEGPISIAQSQDIRFSADGQHMAIQRFGPDGQSISVDGKNYGPYAEIDRFINNVVWSEDGSTLAWLARKDRDNYNQQTLIVNGHEIITRRSIDLVALSRDGKHVAYAVAAEQGFRHELFIDGQLKGDYFAVNEIDFSPDSKTVIWLAADQQPLTASGPGGFDLYVNGEKKASHFQYTGREMSIEGAPALIFSPDGKRWAVRGEMFKPTITAGANWGGYAVMVDGTMGPTFDDVLEGTVQFTPDSKDLLYAAGSGPAGDYAVYRNGIPGRKWKYIAPKSLTLFHAGRSIAYTAFDGPPSRFNAMQHGNPWSPGTPELVIDDKPVIPNCVNWAVNQTGDHVLAEVMDPKGMLNGPLLATLQLDGKKIADVPEFPAHAQLQFSPDGKQSLATLVERFWVNGELFINGSMKKLPLQTDVQSIQIDNAGVVTAYLLNDQKIWKVTTVK
jgi:hypothetical protein